MADREVRNKVVLAVGGNDVANNDPVVRPQEAGQQNLQPDVAAQVKGDMQSSLLIAL